MTSQEITLEVLAALAHPRDERMGQILRSLVTHLHDFARDVELQPDELLAADRFLVDCGTITSESRHEFILLSDTLGLTMVVDTLAAAAADGAFESSVLGPFYRAGCQVMPKGADLSRGENDGEPARIHGRVLDLDRRPVPGATLEVWGTNAAGFYENVDPDQPDWNLRGRFELDDDGAFEMWTVKPVSYPIPSDGPAGELLYAMDRHNMRPGHLHVMLSAPGFRTVVSELFTADDEYLGSDVVFGVKPSLVVDYVQVADPADLRRAGRDRPYWDLEYDFVLTPGAGGGVGFSTDRAPDASEDQA